MNSKICLMLRSSITIHDFLLETLCHRNSLMSPEGRVMVWGGGKGGGGEAKSEKATGDHMGLGRGSLVTS